jgi:hypothetical protein
MEHNCHAKQRHQMDCGPAQLETSDPETWIPRGSPLHPCLHTMPQGTRNPGDLQDHLLLKINSKNGCLGIHFLNKVSELVSKRTIPQKGKH